MFHYTLVGGTFDDAGGRPSGYINRLFEKMKMILPSGALLNGGTFDELVSFQKKWLVNYEGAILWFPNVPNDKEKIVRRLKTDSPRAILVTSKNNLEGKYSFMELVARALQAKSNLFVEFTKGMAKRPLLEDRAPIIAQVCDPLGNTYCKSSSISEIAMTLVVRAQELIKFTRISCQGWPEGSEEIKPCLNPPEKFFEIVRKHAETFHACIHGTDTSRLLGNASFRCESGFPSFKDNGQIFVSKRNIDKRDIGMDGFVPVYLDWRLLGGSLSNFRVIYGGENKPSVDTPIQLMLYEYYPNMRYMLHSHTYIKGASFTSKIIPCGAIEEYFEIIRMNPYSACQHIFLNLKGHGSLVMADRVEILENVDYIPRPIPEKVEDGDI